MKLVKFKGALNLNDIILLKPAFQEKIWGGKKLQEEFGYDIPSDQTGECWAISAHKHGPAIVENGPYTGMTLTELWASEPQLFGNHGAEEIFPLLTKILDAKIDLSVQVHPDDAYAMKHEGELGKTECWYILAADPGSYLIYGHRAQSKEEFAQLVSQGKWDQLLTKVPVKAGDFFYVPSGTVHAIGGGVMVLETQQSSDTTYRLYDWDRKDEKTGQSRELHIKDSLACSQVPFQAPKLTRKTSFCGQTKVTEFVNSKFFSVYRWENHQNQGDFQNKNHDYWLVSVIAGQGQINLGDKTYALKKGTHFIIPSTVTNWTLGGDFTMIASKAN